MKGIYINIILKELYIWRMNKVKSIYLNTLFQTEGATRRLFFPQPAPGSPKHRFFEFPRFH